MIRLDSRELAKVLGLKWDNWVTAVRGLFAWDATGLQSQRRARPQATRPAPGLTGLRLAVGWVPAARTKASSDCFRAARFFRRKTETGRQR